MVWCELRGLTLELTGNRRQDGLARAEKMYRVPQAGPRQPAVGGPVVQRRVRPRSRTHDVLGASWTRAMTATPFRLKAEQGRYSAAAATAKTPEARCARRGAQNGMDCSRGPAGRSLSN